MNMFWTLYLFWIMILIYLSICRYGRVFKSHLFGSPAIVSCDLELNLFILQNEEKLFQAYYPKALHGILGNNSLLVVSGDLHKKLRNIIVSFISSSKSQPQFLWCVEKMWISRMKSWKDRTEVSFFKEAKTVRIMHLVLFFLFFFQLNMSNKIYMK